MKRSVAFDRVARLTPLFCFTIAAVAIYLVRYHVFFWDTVQLGSKHAHFYYEHNFATLLLPQEIDSGHPPTFGLYLAALWLIFGKTLPVSHFAMLPFVWGILYFLWKIGKSITEERKALFLLGMAMVDPTLASQCLLISPDVALACFFLMGVYAILQRHKWLKLLAMLGLAMVSMRGMMTVAALFCFEITIYFKPSLNPLSLKGRPLRGEFAPLGDRGSGGHWYFRTLLYYLKKKQFFIYLPVCSD
jgi:hypothetical protein